MAKKKKEIIGGEEITEDQKFLALALTRFQNLYDAEFHNRETSKEDLEFTYNIGDGQWPASVREERENDGRPCLTFNKLRKHVAHVANYEREQRLAGRVRPVDDKADPDTAKIIEGLVRQIEYASKADEIYADAGEKAIAGGFGFWRLITKEKDDSFDQEIFIEKIENQFSVYLDPEGRYGFIREGISKKEFENRYPGKALAGFEAGVGEEYIHWYEPDKIYIAEYFYKEQYDKTIAQCVNADNGITKIIELTDEITPDLLALNGFTIVQQKTQKADRIKWSKISAHEVLEKGEWAGKYIPIVEVVGDKVEVAGKIYKRSLIRDGKDPQRMFNYWLTHITEMGALIPKSPFILTPQQIKGFETEWQNVNKKSLPFLRYNPIGGQKPQREPPPQIQSGIGQLMAICQENIMDTIGRFEASFGQKSNERTGVAIQQRASRSDLGSFHFHDNFRRAILETTRQLIDLIPKIYDTARIERILGEEGEEAIIPINTEVQDKITGNKKIVNDLSIGKYDVVADVRLFATRRQESAQMMAETMLGAPNIAPLIIDLVFKYEDWPGSQEIKERVEKWMPQLMGQKNNQTIPSGDNGGLE